MKKIIHAKIPDDEWVHIDNTPFNDKLDMVNYLKNLLIDHPNIILLIDPEKIEYFRAIHKIVYASQFAGIPIERIQYKTEDGRIIPMADLQKN